MIPQRYGLKSDAPSQLFGNCRSLGLRCGPRISGPGSRYSRCVDL